MQLHFFHTSVILHIKLSFLLPNSTSIFIYSLINKGPKNCVLLFPKLKTMIHLYYCQSLPPPHKIIDPHYNIWTAAIELEKKERKVISWKMRFMQTSLHIILLFYNIDDISEENISKYVYSHKPKIIKMRKNIVD